MTPSPLSDVVLGALDGLVRRGEVDLCGELPGAVEVHRARVSGRGDFTTGAALRLAPRAGLTAPQLAELLARELAVVPGIASARTQGAGFVDLCLTAAAEQRLLGSIAAAGYAYGATDGSEELRALVDERFARVAGAGGELARTAGADVVRYAVARSSSGALTPADLSRLARADDANPAYRVGYVHARCLGLLRAGTGLHITVADAGAASPVGSVASTPGRELVSLLADYPREVGVAVRRQQPATVARFLEEVAEAFHRFHGSCRVLPQGEEETTDVHRTRLLLVEATRVVVGGGLALLGVTAPARM